MKRKTNNKEIKTNKAKRINNLLHFQEDDEDIVDITLEYDKTTPQKSKGQRSSASRSKSRSVRTTRSSKKTKTRTENEEENVEEKDLNEDLLNIVSPFNLHNWKDSFNLDKRRKNNNSTKLIHQHGQIDLSLYEKFDSFPCDNSLLRQIEVDLVFENKKTGKPNEFLLLNILKDFFSERNFTYYEFSNVRNGSLKKFSANDEINYDFLYEKNLSSQLNNMRTSQAITQIDYLSALSSIFANFLERERYFYFLSPLLSFYFYKMEKDDRESILQEVRDSGVIIANTTKIDKRLERNKIKSKKIELPTEASKANKIYTDVIGNEIEGINLNTSNFLIGIYNHYQVQFFNMIISDYEEENFNIFTPFPFVSAVYRQCKYQIDHYIKNGRLMVNVKLHGCIFPSYLKEIVKFLTFKVHTEVLESLTYSYSMRLHHVSQTSNLFALNRKLMKPVERVEYINNSYYVK